MLPEEVTQSIIANELKAAKAWAMRRGIKLIWLPEQFMLRMILVQPETNEKFYLQGELDSYNAIPPAWTFHDSDWSPAITKTNFPASTPTPWGGTIFHGKPVICAPFNRFAYKEHDGPHADWGGLSNWERAGGNHIKATTIADMLQAIRSHFLITRGRMQ